jgi:hypothetical protein
MRPPSSGEHTGKVSKLPADLAGPVGLELARAVEQLPGPNAMPGGSRYEPKWDAARRLMIPVTIDPEPFLTVAC